MTKEERIALRNTFLYLADAITMINEIAEMNNCNICGKRKTCEYCPRLGKNVRYNCPLYVEPVKSGNSEN